jgi:hypothetical protein
MERPIVVHGRISAHRRIELDEPVTEIQGEVEVVLRPSPRRNDSSESGGLSILDFIARLKAGIRTKEDIDRQVLAERESWGDR